MQSQIGFTFFTGMCFLALGCTPEPETAPKPVDPVEKQASAKKFDFKPRKVNTPAQSKAIVFPQFIDVAEELGVNFRYDNGASPKALMVESTGGGCGWFDFDRDGQPDLYLTQGGPPCPDANSAFPFDALFRQSAGKFIDVAALAGIQDIGYGHGVACGDFDNDGFDDVFVANAGQSQFFRNLGDGTFADETFRLKGLRRAWSSTPAWGDVDRDGDLDLYVCNYAIYDPCNPVECLDKEGIPSICHPRMVEPEPDEFFLNQGDGTLIECAKERGLFGPGNKGLGVVIADLTGDQWPDIYVANDTTANFLFVNQNTGASPGESAAPEATSFQESAMLLGGGFSSSGEPQASMGVAFGDYDRNLLPDLYLTHFTGEHNTLYRNLGAQGMQDVSNLTGMREPSLPKLGFGTVMSDFNGDGHMDLYVTNGHIDPRYKDSEGYEMAPQLFSFDGFAWKECPMETQAFLQRKAVGRAVATADYDRDGDLDLCVVHHNSQTSILRNDSVLQRQLLVRLIGRESCRNGTNSLVRVAHGDAEIKDQQELPGGTSFAATHERVLSFGLGDYTGPVRISVNWSSGQTEDFVELSEKDTNPSKVTSVQIIEGRGAVSIDSPSL